MPIISIFYGIVIRMYFQQSEHNPPHVHALYGDNMAAVTIKTKEIIDGELPPKAYNLVCEWISLHGKELLIIWETQEFLKLDPLK